MSLTGDATRKKVKNMGVEKEKKVAPSREAIAAGFEGEKARIIKRSYELGAEAHKGQKRMSGDPYFSHGAEVACILKQMKMDADTISAGLLHDVVEDTSVTEKRIKDETNEHVAFLVDGVSHVTARVFKTKGKVFSESLKKMFLAMAKDIRVVIIKLADRLHNMRTISYLPSERQKEISQETLDVYAPLANRFGMANVKSELEDLAFSVINPEVYREIADKVARKKAERQKRIDEIIKSLRAEIKEAGIGAEIRGRPKHFYSIFQKMNRENKKFEDIYDLIAFRIITKTIKECYAALGIVHNLWKPVPGRFKDYIAMPKSNMYKSLHTTVLDRNGDTLEIQIRTIKMDEVAEKGIAAHWNYKEDGAFDRETNRAFLWVRQLLEWQTGMRGSDDFIKDLKIDLFDEEVFVFTPRGDVKELVKGATVLDFAYSVHSDLGEKCAGAKVNGKWVTLKYELKNGDMIEVIKGPNQHPVIDWLKIVKTGKAKNRIRHWLRTNRGVEENVNRGEALLRNRLGEFGLSMEDINEQAWEKVFSYYNLKDRKDLLAGIGYGEFSENKIVNSLRKILRKKRPVLKQGRARGVKDKSNIVIDGKYTDITYKLAKCCNPVPGDAITGIYTKRGVSIHRKNCENITAEKITAPFVEVGWSGNTEDYYLIRIKIYSKNKRGVVNDIVSTITKNNAYISSVGPHEHHESMDIDLHIMVKGQAHMNEIITSLRQVKNVTGVERVQGG